MQSKFALIILKICCRKTLRGSSQYLDSCEGKSKNVTLKKDTNMRSSPPKEGTNMHCVSTNDPT